jgi:hypothetical protein
LDLKFQNLLNDLDGALQGRTPDYSLLYTFRADHFLCLPGKVYDNPLAVVHLYEIALEGIADWLPEYDSYQIIIHNHPVGFCSTPNFCFELGFDPSVLPMRVRRNFLSANRQYFEGTDRSDDSNDRSSGGPGNHLSIDL